MIRMILKNVFKCTLGLIIISLVYFAIVFLIALIDPSQGEMTAYTLVSIYKIIIEIMLLFLPLSVFFALLNNYVRYFNNPKWNRFTWSCLVIGLSSLLLWIFIFLLSFAWMMYISYKYAPC